MADRSWGMPARTAERPEVRGILSGRVTDLQAEPFDLPFRPQAFSTVTSFGMLHLFEDLAGTLGALKSPVSPGGSLHATALVGELAAAARRAGTAVVHQQGRLHGILELAWLTT